MKICEKDKNKTNNLRNNLNNHKFLKGIHNMNKEDLISLYEVNSKDLDNLLLKENSYYESQGEIDLDYYLDWLENE